MGSLEVSTSKVRSATARRIRSAISSACSGGVAGEVAVGVVDVAQEVEVGHDQRQGAFEALGAAELLVQRRGEVAGVEEAGLGVDARLGLQGRDAEGAVNQDERGED